MGGWRLPSATWRGRGLPPRCLTAVVQGLLAAEAETVDEPGQVLFRINRTLCRRSVEAKFVTAFYGRIARRACSDTATPVTTRRFS